MNVLVTGSNGFIGANLTIRLKNLGFQVSKINRTNPIEDLNDSLFSTDFIIHLAGENRPTKNEDYFTNNKDFTKSICNALRSSKKNIPIIFTSSIQAILENPYGKSKLQAEKALKSLQEDTNCPVYIYRLPGVFGKWCKPNYNSVVATFCHNISHNLPIKIDNPKAELTLVYIDDVIDEFINVIQDGDIYKNKKLSIQPEYKIKIQDLANLLYSFKQSRKSLSIERVGNGIKSKLYSTYLSYLSPENFTYLIPSYVDDRGVFAEMLKTKDSGQFSFFTAGSGVTRGGHYHNSKSEKFLVIKGEARFRFKHIVSNDFYEIIVNSNELKLVETIPGWAHDITNIGKDDIVVMLWSSEIFDPKKPDTITHELIER